ncbi:MAG: hypothetical protein ACOY0S_04275 [Patescibacteria group bacterium]
MTLKFILVAVISGVTVALGSLLWPKFTRQARPAPLQQVHDLVIKTDLGKEVAGILGVTDETTIAPINIASWAGSLMSSTGEQAQQIVVTQTINRLLQQFEQLPPEQKQQIQQAICKP